MKELSPEELRVKAIFGDDVETKPLYVESVQTEEELESEIVDLITRVCYFYPQYNLETAQELSDSQVTALLLQAEKQRAIELYNRTLISAAPHTKKGKLVEKLIQQYKKVIEL